MEPKTRVIIVDPNPHRRTELLHNSLQRNDIRVLGLYSDLGEAVLEATAHEQPDVLVVNADTAGAQEVRTWALMRSLVCRDMHVIALTSGDRSETLELLLAMGVAGLHPPHVPSPRLLTAIGVVARGSLDMDAALSDKARLSLMGPATEGRLVVGGIELDPEKATARRWGSPLDLTALEFHLLLYLAQNRGSAICIDELLVNVWSAKLGMGGTTDQVKSCVKRLRRKIEPDPIHPRYLYSLRGRGYQLRDPFKADSND